MNMYYKGKYQNAVWQILKRDIFLHVSILRMVSDTGNNLKIMTLELGRWCLPMYKLISSNAFNRSHDTYIFKNIFLPKFMFVSTLVSNSLVNI
jgi:hypothetical protein